MSQVPVENPVFRTSTYLNNAITLLKPASDGAVPELADLRIAQSEVVNAVDELDDQLAVGDQWVRRNAQMALDQASKGQIELNSVIGYLNPESGTARPAVHYTDDALASKLVQASDFFRSAESSLWLESAGG